MESPQELVKDDAEIPPAQRGRRWVWHATLETRAAGKVSVLACVETLLAVGLYWWIAIRYDTHWHLITSVFVAPLLLLRSPESIAAGRRWFMRDWFGFENSRTWGLGRLVFWQGAACLVFLTSAYLIGRWPIRLIGWSWIDWLGTIKLIQFLGAIAVAVASALAALVATFGLLMIGVGIVGAIEVKRGVESWTEERSADAVLGLVCALGFGLGVAVRALFFRVLATLCYFATGLNRVPENWRENNFLTDSLIPAELIPGIRDSDPLLSLDGWVEQMVYERGRSAWIVYPVVGTVFFLPALLYRLNIKATAWFWWPLAYLLKPVPPADIEGQQKQDLCWPWTNPFQKVLIVLSVVLVLTSLTLHYADPTYWSVTKNIPGLVLPLKVAFAIDWAHIAPWHWAQWIIAGAGAGMLALAGTARSHDVNGNWKSFCKNWPRHIRLMTALRRVRALATVSLLLMALGAVLLMDRSWQKRVPVPDRWIQAVERFYQVRHQGAGLLPFRPSPNEIFSSRWAHVLQQRSSSTRLYERSADVDWRSTL